MKDPNWQEYLISLETHSSKGHVSYAEDFFSHLTDYTVLTIAGPDAERFLQGQLTSDMRDLKTGEATLSACCDHQGRMIANFWIWRLSAKDFQICLPKTMSSLLLNHLKKYSLFSKIELKENSDYLITFLKGHQITDAIKDFSLNSLVKCSLGCFLISDIKETIKIGSFLKSQFAMIGNVAFNQLSLEKGIVILYPQTSGHWFFLK